MMENPTIVKKTASPTVVSSNAKKLFKVIYDEQNKKKSGEEVSKIEVSDIISKMSFYYEKIRNSVDYKEEYLLRKNAIFRILKRQVIIEGTIKELRRELDSANIAKILLTELIRAGYLPNNEIPESKIGEISVIIEKYLKLRNLSLPIMEGGNKEKSEAVRWMLAVCASEIEEKLSENKVTQTIISHMYETLIANTELPEGSPYKKDKEIQIYIGIHRIYLKFDRDMIDCLLLKYFVDNWHKADDETIAKAASGFKKLRQSIDNQTNHPLSGQLRRIINRYTVFFTILNDVIEDDPVGVYEGFREDPKAFRRIIKKFCQKRYKAAKVKLRRAAVRSIVYIFLTKMVLAVILEVPVTIWLGEVLNYLSLTVNVSFPPLLLFLIVAFTRIPSDANTNKIVQGVEELVFEENQRTESYRLKRPEKRGPGTNIVFSVLYIATFFLSFGFIVWALDKIHFNFISIIIFMFFLALVSFFGIRIRKVAREMFIVESRENILNLIADFFYVPVVAVGKWLNEKFSRINVFVFILDFIIEAPFKIFVEIAEDWTRYVRERKEEIM